MVLRLSLRESSSAMDGIYRIKNEAFPKRKLNTKLYMSMALIAPKTNICPLQETMEEMGLYILTFDRAGYGESDPNPNRSVKSEAFDIQELADQLHLGNKFYVLGVSVGSYSTWACLKYIPHRLAGASMAPSPINFWWPSFPPILANEAFRKQLIRDRVKLSIAHHVPWLLYWWMTQKLFPYCSILQRHPILFNKRDLATIIEWSKVPNPDEYKVRQQGMQGSLFRDMIVHFGKWEFDPMELKNPFPNNEASVYLWQGHEDKLVPFELQRYVAKKLPWIKYHEVSDGGHLMIHENVLCEAVFRQLLFGEEPCV